MTLAVCDWQTPISSLSHISYPVGNDPKGDLVGMDTPQSSGFDTSSVPFVFNDGFLSFYSPSTDSLGGDSLPRFSPSFSPPSSSVSTAPFLEVLPDSPRYSKSFTLPILQRLAIWRHYDEMDHLYTEINCITSSIRECLSLEDTDSPVIRYSAVHAGLTQISAIACPIMHLFIPLTPFSSSPAEDPHPVNSVITILTPARSPVRLTCAIYNRGTLTFSNDTTLTEEAYLHFGDAQYSTTLPQPFVDELCEAVDGLNSREGTLDQIAVLRFMQCMDTAEGHDENMILVLVCNFHAIQGPGPSQPRFLILSPEPIMTQKLSMQMGSLPTPPPSRESPSDVKHFALRSIQNSKRRNSRVLPKLSVAIPPPCHSKGRIQLCADSPGPTLTLTPNIHFPLTPGTKVPQNVFPVTPFDQLTLPSPHSPDVDDSSVCSRGGHALISMENAYPFILTAASSPSSAQSPAFGLLESPHPEGSGPLWRHPSQICTSTSSYMEAHIDQPLASPYPVTSAAHVLALPPNSTPKSS